MRIIGATLTPFEDAFKGMQFEGYYNADKEQKRQAVNQWIRSSGAFDGVIDFDAAARDPNRPAHILPAFDCGDHLHPAIAGELNWQEVIEPIKGFYEGKADVYPF